VSRRLAGEQGSVLIVVAVALPVLLLFVALIIDAGNWFTHKSQLRNRADAAVRAGGVEYGLQWAKCTSVDETKRAEASAAIVQAAKNYGGAYNDQTGAQVGVDEVVVNDGNPNVCDPLLTSMDVKVTESNVDSLFASFGLPISQASVNSGLELLKASSETGFAPLAIEDQRIVKAQVRLFNACTGTELSDSDNPPELTALPPDGDTPPGMTLWRAQTPITLPSAASADFGCAAESGEPARDYEPVSVQVRLASRDDVDLNAGCTALIAAPFADCFNDITQFRAFACRNKPPPANSFPPSICVGEDAGAGTDGPGDSPDVLTVNFSGPTCAPDPYYARLPSTASSCTFTASVYMNWFDRPEGTCEADLVVDGTPYPMAGPCPRPTENGEWIATGISLTAPGRHNVRVNWRWTSVENGGGWTCAPPAPPCNESDSFVVHRTNLADDPVTDSSPTDIVQLVRVSSAPNIDPVSEIHSVHATGAAATYYVTVGLKSELAPLQFAALRTRFPGNRALVCDPDFLGGQTEIMVAQGCKPPFGVNGLAPSFWWDGTACPPSATWFSAPYTNTPWRCLRSEEQTSSSAEQLANGIAARTGNCSTTPGCGTVQCNTPNHYGDYFESRTLQIDPTDKRFVPVFVVPFGSLKGPADSSVPILEIATFYVTGWGAAGANPGDVCAGADSVRPGRVAGHFVSTVGPNTGPVEPENPSDPSANRCNPSALRPCRAVLVR
jgi:hypothetical protein